ncbi:uncharacterized protein METZ01_LOCUS211623, partial [marine metagenome]
MDSSDPSSVDTDDPTNGGPSVQTSTTRHLMARILIASL